MQSGEATLRYLLEPISEHLSMRGVTEIVCHRPGEVAVEMNGQWAWHKVPEMTYSRLDGIATLAAAITQQDVGPDQPFCASMLPDGQRIQICRPPIVPMGTISLTIRRPSDFTPTLSGLAERGAFKGTVGTGAAVDVTDWIGFFENAVARRLTIILSGGTGSGKTTVAKALGREIPLHERVVTIEDAAELRLPHRNWVSLVYSKGGQGMADVKPEDLMEAALRMRPDRIIMGELRDGAAFTFMRSIAAGHPGSITTCHARNAAGTFTALALMLKQHDAGKRLTDADAMTMLREGVDVIAHCEKRSDGSRGVTEVFQRSST